MPIPSFVRHQSRRFVERYQANASAVLSRNRNRTV
jgi:hypothetical protein